MKKFLERYGRIFAALAMILTTINVNERIVNCLCWSFIVVAVGVCIGKMNYREKRKGKYYE